MSTSKKKYDVVVIGSGPGGYVAAIRAAQLGMTTALVEKYSTLGGTCLNVGCIPSKALLDSSEHFYNANKHFDEHGIGLKSLEVDMKKMIERKNKVVSQTCDGIEFLMKKNKIDVIHGHGSFVDAHTLQVGDTKVSSSHFIIATGSKPTPLPFAPFDKKRIISSTEALSLPEVPKKIVCVGGGIIGLELGSVYARLGTEVHVVEFLDRITPTMDTDVSKELMKALKKIGIKFHLSHKVKEITSTDKGATVVAEDKKGADVTFEGDYCLVSIGRKPYTEGLGLENVNLGVDERGFIPVNDHLQTSSPHIYAIGDVVGGAMLAHKAEEEGIMVVEYIAGQRPHINYRLIPSVVYTWPEASGVGDTEQTLKENKVPYKKGLFPMRALGRSRASGDIDGMVKILAHKDTDELLGMHIVGARAADLIAEGVTAMEYRASAEDIARISHAHPTYTEAIKEAALMATENRPIHS